MFDNTDITCWIPAQESALTDRFVDNVIIINCCLLPILSTSLLLLFCFYLLIFAGVHIVLERRLPAVFMAG